MAKPDLQPVYVDPNDGQLKRLKGKLGLGVSNLNNLPEHNDDTAADGGGIPVGGMYRTGSVIKVRVA
ncbi:MAG: hypothetical protein DRH90_25550 [Deltaproteobacteria bacterium]|nr:MAG: hypothetical protein DRH90_25550 [Deltaproteobacteria bacterium]